MRYNRKEKQIFRRSASSTPSVKPHWKKSTHFIPKFLPISEGDIDRQPVAHGSSPSLLVPMYTFKGFIFINIRKRARPGLLLVHGGQRTALF
jgi:hypothetical protein